MSESPSEALVKKEDVLLTRVRRPAPLPPVHQSGLNKNDILFALFKHKGKIILCTIAGLIGAVAVYFFYPPDYESQAKLLVRYLIERSAVDTIDNATSSGGLTGRGENILGSEVEILTSWDLAVQTAEAVGVKRLLPHATGAPTKEAAARTIASRLEVAPHKGSNIIFVS